MSIIGLIVFLVVLGLIMWAINEAPFIDASIKKVIYIVVVIAAVLYLLQAFGLLGSIHAPVIK